MPMGFRKRESLICHANAYMHTFLIQLSVPPATVLIHAQSSYYDRRLQITSAKVRFLAMNIFI